MTEQKSNNTQVISTTKLLAYIFVPPVLTMIFYILLSVLFHQVVPTMLLFFVSALMILFPIQIYLILKESKNNYGNYSLKSAFTHQEKKPLWLVILLGMSAFGFAGLMTIIWTPLEGMLFESLSDKLYELIPSYFNWKNIEIIASYPKIVLIIMSVLYFILNGFIGPIVEEIFFRGYLTNKLRMNNWIAPLLITILFSIYHFWLPFDLFFRVIAFFPAFYLAWRLKDIRISIIFHCASNIFTVIMFVITIFSM